MAKKKAKSKTDPAIPFEQSLEQLREVVGQLEAGNLTLSESLEKYEQGVASLKSCYQSLNQAQRRIELLVDLDEEGNLVTRSFDDTASDQMTEGTRRSSGRRKSAKNKQVEEDEEECAEDDDDDVEDNDEDEDMDDPNSLF